MLLYFPLITHFTVYGLRSLGSIGRDHLPSQSSWTCFRISEIKFLFSVASRFLRILFTVRTVTESLIEFSRIPLCHTIEVSLIGMTSRNRDIMFSIECEFLRDDSKWFLRDLTLYSPVQDIIRNLRYIIWEFIRWDDLLDFRKWRFVVWVVEDWSVKECIFAWSHCEGGYRGFSFWDFWNNPLCPTGISPSQGSISQDFLSRHRIILLCYRLIISEWTHGAREEFSPFSGFHHVFYDSRNEYFIFFFRILFIQDAVLLVAESDAEETVGTRETNIWIRNILAIQSTKSEQNPICIFYSDTVIIEVAMKCLKIKIICILKFQCIGYIFTIFRFFDVISFIDFWRRDNIFSSYVFR